MSDDALLLKLYNELKASGMMWEFHPDFTGVWEEDKEKWEIFVNDKWPWIRKV